jgi:polyisoprenoid-binding protein YceI
MKPIINFLLTATIITVFCAAAPAPAKSVYAMAKGYAVSIHGTSNLHDWDESVQTVSGEGTIDWNTDGTFDLEAVNMKMEVASIKSTEGSIMNNNTYKALKSDTHPEIAFTLAAPVKSIPAAGGNVATKVNLEIAGVTRLIDLVVKAVPQGHGNITFEGAKTIKMTDFGIKPPVALFGTLKTGDEITIHFKTVFVTNSAL